MNNMEDTRKNITGGSKVDTRNAATATADSPRPYSRPQVLSTEALEAAAATCNPPTDGFGKTGPPTCGTLGS